MSRVQERERAAERFMTSAAWTVSGRRGSWRWVCIGSRGVKRARKTEQAQANSPMTRFHCNQDVNADEPAQQHSKAKRRVALEGREINRKSKREGAEGNKTEETAGSILEGVALRPEQPGDFVIVDS